MTTLRSNVPLPLSIAVGIAAFVALSRIEDASVAARVREDSGLTRGAIVDRNYRPLAFTVRSGRTVRRVYTLPDLADLVGYRDSLGHWHGLEAKYNSFLMGKKARNDWRTYFLHLVAKSAQGGTVRLTIDSRLQEVADRALGSVKGAVVALNPGTGAVLAMVSKPYCSPTLLESAKGYQQCRRDPGDPLLNRALQLTLPPGSAFKIVTLSAALDTGRFHLGQIFSGTDAWGPSPYFDNSTYPSNVTRADLTQLSLQQALAFSDNFTFAHIGLTLGAPTLLGYAHRFYVGRKVPFDFPVVSSSIANNLPNPNPSEVAQSSFGADVDHVTPLQMGLIAATVANRGVMMAPHLIKDLHAPNGKMLLRYHDHPLNRVMSGRGAADVAVGMKFVVDHGSGYKAQIPGVNVAGKTGTAASGGYFPHAWFIAFAPLEHPVVAVAVLHEFSGEGFKYAAPIARQVLVAGLQERGFRVK